MRAVFGFLLRRKTVLAAFLLLKLAAVVMTGITTGGTEVWGIGILALMTYGVITWFAYKRTVISIWAISIIMLYEGTGILLGGIARLDSAPAIALLSIILAVYLVLGAMVVFSSRHARG